MKAIETHYKGYRFRSRLEARWAVFFDQLGIDWQYEPEGFEFNDGSRYLPDFYLPDMDLWVEIKGRSPSKAEIAKLRQLVRHTKSRATFRVGEPFFNVDIAEFRRPESSGDMWVYEICTLHDGAIDVGSDGPYLFCLCPWCGRVGLEYDGRGARVCGYKKHYDDYDSALNAIKHLGHWRADDKCYTADHPSIKTAAIKARSARFEFGEAPA